MVLRFPMQHSIKHLACTRKAIVPNTLPPHSVSTGTLHLPCTLNGRRMSASTHCTSSVVLPHAVSSGSVEEDVLVGFVMGRRKATELAHSIWKNVVNMGDTVVDATCGNGYDTLALLKMVADESNNGFVYGMDIQNSALEKTSSLLDESVTANERKNVKLFHLCHSKMEDVIPKNISVRVVTFNLGYLPGEDKDIITVPRTTLLALQAAARILARGGLISVVVYVGHPGGREELQTVQSFASSLPTDGWVSCKFEVLNRPNAPILVLLFRK